MGRPKLRAQVLDELGLALVDILGRFASFTDNMSQPHNHCPAPRAQRPVPSATATAVIAAITTISFPASAAANVEKGLWNNLKSGTPAIPESRPKFLKQNPGRTPKFTNNNSPTESLGAGADGPKACQDSGQEGHQHTLL